MTTTTIEAFVEAHFTVKSRTGSEWSVLCPAHGDRNASMRINVAKGKYFCHGCHVGGGMRSLGKLVGVPFSEVNSPEMDLAMLQSKLATLRDRPTEPVVYLPESALLRYDLPTDYWTVTRKFSNETVTAFDLGYDPIKECVTIPVRDVTGGLLGFTKRYLDPDADLRYQDPKGFKKANNLFGSWMAAADDSPTLVLTEGPVDAMKVWQSGHAAVAQFGSYITPRQIKLLRDLGTLQVVLFYDNDQGGREAVDYAKGWHTDADGRKRYDPAHDLRQFFVVRRVAYRTSAKDPGAMADSSIDEHICNARLLR